MASTVWKGYISFGLISVPIRLFVAAREQHISFNQVHQVCAHASSSRFTARTASAWWSAARSPGLPRRQRNFVLVSNEELKALEAQSSETMEIVQFVNLPDVRSALLPDSYSALLKIRDAGVLADPQGMQQLKLGAIAKITLHQREQIVMIRPFEKGLVLHTLYYPEEIRAVAEYDNQPEVEVQKAEVELAEQFMKQLTGEFHPEKFKDEYEGRSNS